MSWDKIWDEIHAEVELGKYPGEPLIQFIARNYYPRISGNLGHRSPKKEDRIEKKFLELGCGKGANIWYLAREFFDISGIDGSRTAISKAKKRLAKESLSADLVVGDIINLPYANEEFDLVIDNECIYCNSLKNSYAIMEEARRVMKAGALFYSRTFADNTYTGKSKKEHGYLEFSDISDGIFLNRGFVRLIDREGIDSLYGKLFDILSVDKLEYTYNNMTGTISEWIIICQKR